MNQPRISVFPKCFFDDLCRGTMNYLDWLRQAATLGAEGVEHYDGFFPNLDAAGVEPVRRTLSGQRYPGMSRREGVERTLEGLRRALEYAERRGVILCMENHYKDGNWQYPEFAQPEDIFLEIVGQIDSPHFGVQYDPSNATVGGYDPLALLEKVKHRVVSMHASDRYLEPGTTLDELRRSVEFLKRKRREYYG